MNFLRRRLLMAYGLLLVLLGMSPGGAIGERFFPPAHQYAEDAISAGLSVDMKVPVTIAHVLLVAFVVVLHLRPRESDVLGERPRNWLIFTYGAYAIGVVMGVVVAGVMR